jgi:hypothetical protein
VSKYLADWLEYCHRSQEEGRRKNAGLREQLLQRLAERAAQEQPQS